MGQIVYEVRYIDGKTIKVFKEEQPARDFLDTITDFDGAVFLMKCEILQILTNGEI